MLRSPYHQTQLQQHNRALSPESVVLRPPANLLLVTLRPPEELLPTRSLGPHQVELRPQALDPASPRPTRQRALTLSTQPQPMRTVGSGRPRQLSSLEVNP